MPVLGGNGGSVVIIQIKLKCGHLPIALFVSSLTYSFSLQEIKIPVGADIAVVNDFK